MLFALSIMTSVAYRRYFCEIYSHCKLVCYCTLFFIISLYQHPLPQHPMHMFHLTCHWILSNKLSCRTTFFLKATSFVRCLVCILISLSLPFHFLASSLYIQDINTLFLQLSKQKSFFSCNTDIPVIFIGMKNIKTDYQTWTQSLTLLQVELVNWFALWFLKNVSLFKHFLQLSLTVWRLFYCIYIYF